MKFLNAIWTALQSQRERWILWTPVPLAAGIGIYFSLPSEPAAMTGVCLLAIALLGLLPFYKDRVAVRIWGIFFLVALGFAAAQFRTLQVEAPVLHKKAYQALTVRGRVIDIDALEKAYRVTLDNLSFDGEIPQARMPERVRIKLKNNDPAVPAAGDIVEIKAVLSPLPTPVLPWAYDFQQASYFRKLGATGYALSDLSVVTPHQTDFFFENLRRVIRQRVADADLGPKNIQALTIAFLIGDGSAITKHDWDVARFSGIAHLVAISGSHFAMIVGVVFFLTRAILAAFPYAALHWPLKKISACAGMLAAVFYTLLIGSPIPAQRAVVMSCGVLLAVMFDRDPFSLRITALAALLVLLAEPESLMGASFQMSFAAVIGLVSFFESTRGWWLQKYREAGFLKKCGLFVLTCFFTTLAATLATGPFSLFHFLHVSFFSALAANMIAVPLSSFVTFPIGLLACLLMPFGLEKFPLWIMVESIKFIMWTAEKIAAWPHMVFYADAWPGYWLVVIAIGGLWLCLWQGKVRWLGLAPILVAAVFIPLRPRPDILVGSQFKLLAAVRDDTGKLWISPGRADKFIRNEWIDREGEDGNDLWPETGNVGDFLSCDSRACVYKMKGSTAVFIADGEATEADCANADIVVTPRAVKPEFCTRPRLFIDKWKLYDDGAHMIYLKPFRVMTVADERGVRPWTGRRPYKPKVFKFVDDEDDE